MKPFELRSRLPFRGVPRSPGLGPLGTSKWQPGSQLLSGGPLLFLSYGLQCHVDSILHSIDSCSKVIVGKKKSATGKGLLPEGGALRVLSATLILSKICRVWNANARLVSANLG